MGLKKDMLLDSGIYLPEAYIKITSCVFVMGYHVNINVSVYKDYAAREDKKSPVASFKHICTTDYHEYFGIDVLNKEGNNIISQAYEWLKTQKFYEDAKEELTPKEEEER